MLDKFVFSENEVIHTKYRLYQYSDTYFRIVSIKFYKDSGYELISDNYISIDDDIDNLYFKDSESLRCSRSRSRRKIREYALCNNFEYFVTLTINSINCDRFSLTQCQELLRNKLKYFKHKNKDFAYLLITEKHKDGAFHFHGLFRGIDESDLIEYKIEDFKKLPKYIIDKIYTNEKIYYLKYFSDKIGYCTLSKIKDLSKVSSYITKYITKECIVNENGYMYICSRNLRLPYVSDIKPLSLEGLECFNKNYDFCNTYDFDFNILSVADKIYLINHIEDLSIKEKFKNLLLNSIDSEILKNRIIKLLSD